MEIKKEAFQTTQVIALLLKDKRKIPIVQTENLGNSKETEEKASELSHFLNVPLKNI